MTAAELLLLGGVVLSIVRPRDRVWPPPGWRSWRFWWSWGLLVVTLGGGLALGWLDRGSFVLDAAAWRWVGGGLIAGAALFNEWAVHTLGRRASRGLGGPLVAAGPYALSRNPQYLAQSGMILGIVVLADSAFLAVDGALGVAILFLTPRAEEPWLEREHGAAYREYRRRVPRFLGRRKKPPR